MQEWSRLNGNGQPISDVEARARGVHMLFLPGAVIPTPADNLASLVQGFSLRFAPDLVSSDIAEDMVLRG